MNMRISSLYNAYENFNTTKSSATQRTTRAQEKKDMVAISGQAKDFQTAMRAVKDVEDIRSDKVADLRQKMESGSYFVNSKEVANKIVSGI